MLLWSTELLRLYEPSDCRRFVFIWSILASKFDFGDNTAFGSAALSFLSSRFFSTYKPENLAYFGDKSLPQQQQQVSSAQQHIPKQSPPFLCRRLISQTIAAEKIVSTDK